MINENNYIEFIVDYFDGQLTESQQNALLKFIDENPEFQEDFDTYAEMTNEPLLEKHNPIPADLISKLKNIPEKTINEENEKLIAYVENDLSESERIKLENAIEENSEMQRSLSLLKKARFEADTSITYPNKKALKRFMISPMIKRTMFAVSSAAAIFLLFWNIMSADKIDSTNKRLLSHNSVFPSFTEQLPLFENQNEDVQENIQFYQETNLTQIQYNTIEKMETMPLISKISMDIEQNEIENSISDIRTEYIEIYAYSKLKAVKNQEENKIETKNKLGTFSEWTDWAFQTVNGKKSIKDNPANELTFSDVANFGIGTVGRISGKEIPFAIK